MNRLVLPLACVAMVAASSAASAGVIIWDFNPAGKNASVKATSKSFFGSPTGLNPDPTTPPVIVAGFNANKTAHTLFYKKAGKTERGLGLTGTRNGELTLTKNGAEIANFLRIDMTAVQALKLRDMTLSISMQSVDRNSSKDQERFDIWGSDLPDSFGSKLITASAINGVFLPVPIDPAHLPRYLYVSTTPGTKYNRHDNVLLAAIKVDGTTPLPEPASLSLLAAGGLALLRRRRGG